MEDAFHRLNHSPPTNSGTILFDPIKERINRFLAAIKKPENDLDDEQRAKLLFLFLKNQDEFLAAKNVALTADRVNAMMWDAVDKSQPSQSESNRRLGVFVCQGGDATLDEFDYHHGTAASETFLSTYPEWRDASALLFTLTDLPTIIKPLLRY